MPLDDFLFTDEKIKNDFNKFRTIPGKQYTLAYC